MKVVLTPHAVERYGERVKPALDLVQCRAELEALCDMATDDALSKELPFEQARHDYDCVLTISPGVWLLLADQRSRLIAITVYVNHSFSQAHRDAKREYRRHKRRVRELKRKMRTRPETP